MTQNPFERVFMCVGTTEFDALVREIDSQQMLRLLEEKGCKELVMQIGRGSVQPLLLQETAARHGIAFSFYTFKPSLKEDMQRATLIISHAGTRLLPLSLCVVPL
jgi:beta-1,4-N-acetylglucosaminyltransferase